MGIEENKVGWAPEAFDCAVQKLDAFTGNNMTRRIWEVTC
jgi:hypothetical protein